LAQVGHPKSVVAQNSPASAGKMEHEQAYHLPTPRSYSKEPLRLFMQVSSQISRIRLTLASSLADIDATSDNF